MLTGFLINYTNTEDGDCMSLFLCHVCSFEVHCFADESNLAQILDVNKLRSLLLAAVRM